MYQIYKILTSLCSPIFVYILSERYKAGKEIPERFHEKKAIISKNRPSGKLIWIHAASIGEAQSALILIDNFIEQYNNLNILVTTGTITSARIMEEKLPKQTFHQFYPLDHPKWVEKFINHWKPDGVIWIESELWPNMLHEIKKNNIPAILVNARMSNKSFYTWKKLKPLAQSTLSTFDKVLCQTKIDKQYFTELGANNVIITDNIKYSALDLSYDKTTLEQLTKHIKNRPTWLYSSTHKGEEELACTIHIELKKQFPNLITIIVPRHPERREEIKKTCQKFYLNIKFRGNDKVAPAEKDDIYIADTLGELGIFYRLSPIACIGRTFSDDGGGGHNPIEAAQLACAVIHGPNTQNLQNIFDEMDKANAAICLKTPNELSNAISNLLTNKNKLEALQATGKQYANNKSNVIVRIISELEPMLSSLNAD